MVQNTSIKMAEIYKWYGNHKEKGKHSKLMKKVPEEAVEEERKTRKVRKRRQLQNNFLLY